MSDLERMFQVLEDASKHLSEIAKCKVQVSMSIKPEEVFIPEYNPKEEKSIQDLLVEIICLHFQLHSILWHSKKRLQSEARWAFCIIARKHTGMGLREIGEYLRRDHTTVIHGITRGQDLMAMPNEPFARKMKEIEKDFLNIINQSKNDNHDQNGRKGLGEG
jgi:chromosomal replication initiation ATPase DnaA